MFLLLLTGINFKMEETFSEDEGKLFLPEDLRRILLFLFF